MKNLLNAVTAICIILFLGWQFCGDCCEKKCDKSDTKECNYSKYEKSGATKCKSYETKKECPHANKEESIVTYEEVTTESGDENPVDEDQEVDEVVQEEEGDK